MGNPRAVVLPAQAQLVAAVHRQHWAFALQDLRCVKCKQVLNTVQGADVK